MSAALSAERAAVLHAARAATRVARSLESRDGELTALAFGSAHRRACELERQRERRVVASAAALLSGAHSRGQHSSVRRGARVLRARGRRARSRPDEHPTERLRRAVRPGFSRATGVCFRTVTSADR